MQTLVELLERRARDGSTPYTFLEDGDADARSLTATELDQRARRISGALAALAKPGERALLVAPPGLDYIAAFFGCLYAGVIAVPAYPPDPRRLARTLPRLLAIASAADASVILAPRALLETARALVPHLHALAIDEPGTDEHRAGVRADTIAMLQFTSGSTAAPRGVILTHAHLLANLAAIERAFSFSADDRVVSWLPPYHDMGLIGAILGPLFVGASTVLMSPLHFLQRPARWLRAITHYRATVSGGPNFAYDLCVRKIDLEREQLDLTSWSLAFDGAEVVRASTLDRFRAKFAGVGFRRTALTPCYGLAEATLLATTAPRDAEPAVRPIAGGERVSSGRPAPGVEVVIADASGAELGAGEVGEVWLRGASIGGGYWGLPADEAFCATLAGGRGPYLRTGDLGALVDGELYVTGRSKDLVIFSGRKLFPDDLERVAAAAHPALRPACAAFAVEVEDQERLVIACEVDGDAPGEADDARAAITRALVEAFDVAPHAIVLVAAGELPKTSSGKLQRHACRRAWLAREMRGQ